jgi:hypothetical protein
MGLGLYIPRIKHITLLHMLCFTFLLHGPNQCVPMQDHSNLARYPTQVQQNKSRQKKKTLPGMPHSTASDLAGGHTRPTAGGVLIINC